MMTTKFHENRLIIDVEINEKYALLVSSGLRHREQDDPYCQVRIFKSQCLQKTNMSAFL